MAIFLSKVLKGAWEKKTYTKIPQETNHDFDYIKGVGSYIFKIISQALKTKVNKRNICSITKRNYQKIAEISNIIKTDRVVPNLKQNTPELLVQKQTTSQN